MGGVEVAWKGGFRSGSLEVRTCEAVSGGRIFASDRFNFSVDDYALFDESARFLSDSAM